MSTPSSLQARLRAVGRRLWLIGTAQSGLWGGIAAGVLLLLAAWLDLVWELPAGARLGAWLVAGAGALGVLGGIARRTFLAARAPRVAHAMDEAGHTGGQILTGLELDAPQAGVQNPLSAELTEGMARMAVAQADRTAQGIRPSAAAPARPLRRPLAVTAALAALLALLILLMPRLAVTQWTRLVAPYDDVPPYSATALEVEPGNKAVLYGGSQEIVARVVGPDVDRVELVLETADGRQEVLPMFPAEERLWRTVLERITEPTRYFVRAYDARSRRFRLSVITVPRIQEVIFTVTPPAYTRQKPYTGPMPPGGLAGLPGTRVEVCARSNRSLSEGSLELVVSQEKGDEPTGKSPPARKESRTTKKLVATGEREVRGTFEITGDGRFELGVVDRQGQRSTEPFTGAITLLADQRPLVRLSKPQRLSLATPGAALPVEVSAEDDYGVAGVQLYRGLNRSRPLAQDVSPEEGPSRQVQQSVGLPLSQYGLQPGDEIQLFARAEDNNPSDIQGAETPIATVRIVSQADFERLVQRREGLGALLSKYRAARRRMEALTQQLEALQKAVAEAPEESPVSRETREKMEQLAGQAEEDARTTHRSAGQPLPYDIDQNLAPELHQLAGAEEQAAEDLRKAAEDNALENRQLAEELDRLAARMEAEANLFEQEAMAPMEQLAKVMPLLADQAKYTRLAQRQRDLADRMKTLREKAQADDPALQARMRDLESQQQQVRADLQKLLEAIRDHAEQLPDQPELKELADSAKKFAGEVETSGAALAMAGAESALAEFAGQRGHEEAQRAAELLEKFLSNEVGEEGEGALTFQPGLQGKLGDTVEQLLAAMGMGQGNGGGGFGMGWGDGDGRGDAGGEDIGLYGSLPGIADSYRNGFGPESDAATAPASSPGVANPDLPGVAVDPGQRVMGGMGEGLIPARYQRRVGQYFRRLADELK